MVTFPRPPWGMIWSVSSSGFVVNSSCSGFDFTGKVWDIFAATMFDLHQKVAVVTGAGSGIGAAIATLFGRQGARVVVLDRHETAWTTADAIRAAGRDALARQCDGSSAADVSRALPAVSAPTGLVA